MVSLSPVDNNQKQKISAKPFSLNSTLVAEGGARLYSHAKLPDGAGEVLSSDLLTKNPTRRDYDIVTVNNKKIPIFNLESGLRGILISEGGYDETLRLEYVKDRQEAWEKVSKIGTANESVTGVIVHGSKQWETFVDWADRVREANKKS